MIKSLSNIRCHIQFAFYISSCKSRVDETFIECAYGVIGTLIYWIKMSDYLEITAFSQLIM